MVEHPLLEKKTRNGAESMQVEAVRRQVGVVNWFSPRTNLEQMNFLQFVCSKFIANLDLDPTDRGGYCRGRIDRVEIGGHQKFFRR
jgi:hypothetical protein